MADNKNLMRLAFQSVVDIFNIESLRDLQREALEKLTNLNLNYNFQITTRTRCTVHTPSRPSRGVMDCVGGDGDTCTFL